MEQMMINQKKNTKEIYDMKKYDNIPGWPGYYISKRGILYTSKYIKGKWHRMRGHITARGRYSVTLKNKGKKKRTGVSRLVALAWIPNPNNYPIVMHLDNDPLNNHYKNLKWGTSKMNNDQARNEGRNFCTVKGDQNINRKILVKQESEIRIKYHRAVKQIIGDLAKEYGIKSRWIRKIISKKTIKPISR